MRRMLSLAFSPLLFSVTYTSVTSAVVWPSKKNMDAFGDIGRDQLFYLTRVGFNAFVLGEGKNAEEAL